MSTIKLSPEDTRKLYQEDGIADFGVVESGSWDADNKIQTLTHIVKQVSTGKYFSFSIYRSGSPFTDYHYSYDDDEGAELEEVKRITKISYAWVGVDENDTNNPPIFPEPDGYSPEGETSA